MEEEDDDDCQVSIFDIEIPESKEQPVPTEAIQLSQDVQIIIESACVQVWGSARLLAAWLLTGDGQELVANRSVLELGAGLGLPSIACAISGASSAVATDMCQGSVQALRRLLAQRYAETAWAGHLDMYVLNWRDCMEPTFAPRALVDVVIAADCHYYTSALEPLVAAMQKHLKSSGVLVLASKEGRVSLDEGRAMLLREGFTEMRVIPLRSELLQLGLDDDHFATMLQKDAATERTLFKAPGSQILQIFSQASLRGEGITDKDAKRITSMVRKAITVLTFSMESTANSGGLYLDKLQAILVAMFRSDPGELDKNYQVLIYEEDGDGAKRGAKRKSVDFFSNMGPTGGDREEAKRTLCLWCLSCSVALRELVQREVRSMIITSGTLSPIEGTVEDFGVPFPIVLENDHVIDPKRQLWGAVLTAGPSNVRFDASFDGRNDPNYLRDLGNAVARFAACVPDGVLLAFQSYARKDAVLQAWRQSGIYDEIQKQKPVFEEPTYHAEMKRMFEKYKTALAQPPTAARPMGGAILAAVCRGKLCEGIDFSDRECRMVIVVGIPYPARNDLRVLLKQSFLDSRGTEGDGRKWYVREAVRAVNQTLGRVIRHRNDFGGVLLCDDRYASYGRLSSLAMQLPSWLRPQVGVVSSFENALQSCRHFFGVAAPTLQQEKSTPAEARPGVQADAEAAGNKSVGPLSAAAVANANRVTSSMASATTAAGAQGSAASAASNNVGVPLSALGTMWKDRRKLRLLSRPAALPSGPAAKPSVNVFAKRSAQADGLESTTSVNRPAAIDGGANSRGPATPQVPAASPPAGALRRVGVAPEPQRVATRGSTSEPSPHIGRWLRAAEALLPRMEYDVVRRQLSLLLRQADEALASTQTGVDVEERLESTMTSVAEALLPEFSFDTPEEKRKRDNLVKECMLLLPRLLRPLWRERVEEILRAQQKPSIAFAR